MVNESIKNQTKKALEKLGLPSIEVELEHPAEEMHGDYASNIALTMFGNDKFSKSNFQANSPKDLAEGIAKEIRKELPKFLERVEVAGPGFINFWLSEDYLLGEMQNVLKLKDKFGKGNSLMGKKISVEYTDPNPFKEFHIGHLYSNLIGESIAKIFEANGAKVWRADFYGDVGMHVAKSVWGMMKKMKEEKVTLAQLEKRSLKKRQEFLGKGYAMGVNKYEESKEVQEEIKELNYIIYIANQEYRKREKVWRPIINYAQYVDVDGERLRMIQEIYEAGLKWSLEYFEIIYKRLGTRFDGYYPESWVGELGMKIVEKGLKKGVLIKSKGAVVFEGEKHGLHTRVFVNKLGLPTYEAKDLGLARAKYDDFQFDLSINVFGKEIDEYYKVVKLAMEKIEPELGKKSEHLAHGMVNLPEGKMSSRTGNIITCEWLFDETKERVLEIMKNSEVRNKEKVAEVITQGAIKYAFLRSGIGGNVVFDFGESVSFEGNSGPYIQYTFARCKSVLSKSKVKSQKSKLQLKTQSYPFNQEEWAIMRWLYRFPEVVALSGKEYSPNLICTYLFELAQRFNRFYNHHTILGKQFKPRASKAKLEMEAGVMNSELRDFRLGLTRATAQVLKNGLDLLGIEAPQKM